MTTIPMANAKQPLALEKRIGILAWEVLRSARLANAPLPVRLPF